MTQTWPQTAQFARLGGERVPVDPTPTSQEGRILAALRAGERLTPLMALRILGCMSLSQRVSVLRRRYQQPIKVKLVRRGKKHVCEYSL